MKFSIKHYLEPIQNSKSHRQSIKKKESTHRLGTGAKKNRIKKRSASIYLIFVDQTKIRRVSKRKKESTLGGGGWNRACTSANQLAARALCARSYFPIPFAPFRLLHARYPSMRLHPSAEYTPRHVPPLFMTLFSTSITNAIDFSGGILRLANPSARGPAPVKNLYRFEPAPNLASFSRFEM